MLHKYRVHPIWHSYVCNYSQKEMCDSGKLQAIMQLRFLNKIYPMPSVIMSVIIVCGVYYINGIVPEVQLCCLQGKIK